MMLVDNLKKFSVVISVYAIEREHDLLRCINSLKNQTLLPQEIILVLDPDPDLVKFYKARIPPEIKIVVSNGIGLSNARNCGIKNSVADFVAFIDDDAFADTKWLEMLSMNYKDPNVIGVGGSANPLWQVKCPNWLPEELYWTVGCSHKMLLKCKNSVRNPIGCNMSFRRSIFEKTGYFDSTIGRYGKKLLSGEEAFLSFNALMKIPYSKIIYEPAASVVHKVSEKRTTIKYVLLRSYYEGYSKGIISRIGKKNGNFLSSEKYYLKMLIKESIPDKLNKLYQYQYFLQLSTLIMSTGLVFLGYLAGRASKNGDK